MCVSPSFIWHAVGNGHEQVPVPCKVCWQCVSNRINDYVGRGLCEAAFSKTTYALTLTYAPREDLAELIITPPHFQDFIRALRRRDHVLRYIGAGEYGEEKGRAHFHAVLFFREGGPIPDWPHRKNFHDETWPHGHMFAERFDGLEDFKKVRYVCKYAVKDTSKTEAQSWFTLSKKPSIGSEFHQLRAQKYIEAGLLPRSFEYVAPGGKPGKTYLMKGATKRDFLNTVCEGLRIRGLLPEGGFSLNRKFVTASEWVSDAIEKFDKQLRIKSYKDGWRVPYSHHVENYRQYSAFLSSLDLNRISEERIALRIFLGEYPEDEEITQEDIERAKETARLSYGR